MLKVLKHKYISILLLFMTLMINDLHSQNKIPAIKQFWRVSRYEKCWAIKHLLVASKAWKVTKYVRQVTDSVAKSGILDGDIDGGQVDAFRHAYWMAMLSQKMNAKKALSLGIAHEKGDYLKYKKHRMEEGNFPDKISSDMDLYNNKIGVEIGMGAARTDPVISADSLKQKVIENILKGKMKMIKKNKKGEFLDENNNIISNESLIGKWENNKVLVSSDEVR